MNPNCCIIYLDDFNINLDTCFMKIFSMLSPAYWIGFQMRKFEGLLWNTFMVNDVQLETGRWTCFKNGVLK